MSTPETRPPEDRTSWLLYLFLAPMALVALAGIVAVVVALLPKSP